MREKRFLDGRALDLSNLDKPVARVVFTTYAILIGLILGIAFHEQLGSPQPLNNWGFPFAFRPGAIIATALVAGTAFSLLFAGLAKARTGWRYVVLPFTVIAFGVMFSFFDFGRFPMAKRLLLLGVPVLLTLACTTIFILGRRLRITSVLWLSLAALIAFISAMAVLSATVWPSYGSNILLLFIFAAMIFLEPALITVGFDAVELGAEFLGTQVRRLERISATKGRFARVAIILVAAAWVVLDLGTGSRVLYVALFWAGTLMVGAMVFGLAIQRRSLGMIRAQAHLDYRHVLIIAAAIYLAAGVAQHFKADDQNSFIFQGSPAISIGKWRGMNSRPTLLDDDPPAALDAARGVVRRTELTQNSTPVISVLGVPTPTAKSSAPLPQTINELSAATRGFPIMRLQLGPESEGWRRGDASGDYFRTRMRFVVFARQYHAMGSLPEMTWYIMCAEHRDVPAEQLVELCEFTRSNFMLGARQKTAPIAALVLDGLLLAIAALALVAGLRKGRTVDAPLFDFVFWVALIAGLWGVGSILFNIHGGTPMANIGDEGSVLIDALILACVVGAVALETMPARWAQHINNGAARWCATEAVVAALATQAIFLLYVVAASHAEASQVSRAAIVCAALTIELMTAGRILNPRTEAHHVFGRSSRVLIFVGYIMLVGSTVFLFAETDMPSDFPTVGWDPELLVASGILMLGGAWVLWKAGRAIAALKVWPEPEDESPVLESPAVV